MRCPGCVRLTTMAALGVVCASSCIPYFDALISRASHEYNCPPDRINVIARGDISYGLYDVAACGQRARYTCVGGHREPRRCIHEPDPPVWDPDPVLAANLPSGPSESGPPPGPGGHSRWICGPVDSGCAFKEGGTWHWRPPPVDSCGGSPLCE